MNFIYRTAASFVASRAGLEPKPLLLQSDLSHSGIKGQKKYPSLSPHSPVRNSSISTPQLNFDVESDVRGGVEPGGLIVVGSYVPKTSEQLQKLISE